MYCLKSYLLAREGVAEFARSLPINSLLNNQAGEGIFGDYRWWATPGNKNERTYVILKFSCINIYFHGFTARDNESVLVFTDTTNVRCGRQNNDGSRA